MDQQAGPGFLSGGGECGALMRALDWSATPLGSPSAWPQTLRTLVGVVLGSHQPMLIVWGVERTTLYNDGYAEMCGARHPGALGRPFEELWHDIWDRVEPILARAYAGGSTRMDDIAFTMRRNGYPEETHFAFGYTPVRDETGRVAGMFCACIETTGRVAAERKLRESEDNYRHAVDLSPQTVWTACPDGQLDHVGPRWREWTGTSGLGSGWGDALHPDDLTRTVEAWTRSIATGEPYDIQHRARFRDGSYRWMRSRAFPRRDGSGRIVRWYGTTEDIHAARAAEEAVRESEARHRQIFDSAVDYAIVASDLEGRTTRWNEGARRILGWTEEEMLGQTAHRFFTPEDRADGQAETEMRCALENGAAKDERWHLRKTGERFWASGEMTPLRDEAGRAVGFVKVLRDRTEQRLAESRLRESEARFRNMADQAPVMMWITDPSGHCTYLNRRWYEFTGQGEEEALGLGWTKATHPDDQKLAEEAFLSANAAQAPFQVEYRLRRADGAYRWAIDAASPRFGEGGAFLGYVGSVIDIDERREAENAVREAGDRLRLAAEATGVGIWDFDPVSGALRWDNRCKELFGLPPSAAVDYGTFLTGLHPDDREATDAAVRGALAPDGPGEYEVEYRTVGLEDRVERWIAAKGRAFFEGSGSARHAARFVGTVVDISERKRAEARRLALVELGDRIRDLDDPADLSFAAAEILGRALGVSRAGYGTINTAAETVTIERDWNAPGIKSLAGVLRFRDYGSYIEDLKRGETVVFADAEKDPRTAATAGALKAISAQAVVNMPVTEQGGFVALLYLNHETAREWPADELAFVREVADRTRTAVERRRAEQGLRELAASLERQVEERTAERDRVWKNSRDLLVVVGADGVFRAVNPAWTAILGHAPAEVVGRSFLEFVWPEDAELTRGGLDTAASKNDLTDFENRYRHKDGTPRWISWRTSLEGDLVYAYGRDVTAEKEQAEALRLAEEQLRQSQKMEAVGQLTGGIAHDFNNLLTGITGSLELLSARISQGRIMEVDRYVTAARGAAKRAAALTHRLLAFSRRQTLDPKPTDVNRLVAGMEELVRRTVGPEVAVEVVAAGGLWTTLVDPNQLENALLNLCINARDAMPDGGRLTIETANRWLDARAAMERDLPPGQYVSLCVSDTGSGMTPDVARRAFDPFFTTKPIGMGTGLGLSMIYGFVRQSGGQARIYSEPGHGTMVCLYLPRHHGADEGGDGGIQLAAEAPPPRAERGETVLVVDDEPTVRMLIGEVLGDLGYTAIEAADGASGLKALRSAARVDLLVTDVGLPGGMNGRQLADAARQARPGLRVLFITGYAENAVLNHGHLEPGMHVLTKPFSMEALASRIKDLIAGV